MCVIYWCDHVSKNFSLLHSNELIQPQATGGRRVNFDTRLCNITHLSVWERNVWTWGINDENTHNKNLIFGVMQKVHNFCGISVLGNDMDAW